MIKIKLKTEHGITPIDMCSTWYNNDEYHIAKRLDGKNSKIAVIIIEECIEDILEQYPEFKEIENSVDLQEFHTINSKKDLKKSICAFVLLNLYICKKCANSVEGVFICKNKKFKYLDKNGIVVCN